MRKNNILLLIVLIVVCFSISLNLVHASSLFSDDFEDGDATGWTTQYGSWSVVSDAGNYVYYQSSTNEGRTWIGTATWSDYSVTAKVKVTNFNGSNRAYVCARLTDGNNFYAASLCGNGKIELRKKVSGSTTTLASASYTIATNTWYTVKLVVNGATLSMYINDSLQLSATDSSLSSGKIGLIAYKVAAEFDDISVTDAGSSNASASAATAGSATQTASTASSSASAAATAATTTTVTSGDLFVGPNGSDSNSGTVSSPLTLAAAITKIAAGKTIYLLGGTYNLASTITIARDNCGNSSALKSISAYNDEEPVLSFSAMSTGSSNRGLQVFGNYWYIKGLTIEYAGDNGMFIGGNYNTVDNCEFRYNQDSGLQISRYASSVSSISDWPSYNLILNCYSHDNYDTDDGEDADGFACKLTAGYGNVFRGCIAAYNIDDGWDLYTKDETGVIGPVTIEGCIAYCNGAVSSGTSTSDSDGNGFKLGGASIAVNHIVKRCIAFSNKKHGFTYNSNPGSISLTNCTAYNNGTKSGSNFAFDKGTHLFTNLLSYQASSSDKTSGTDVSSTNVWWKNSASTNAKGLVCSSADFASLAATVTRNSDGSPNLGSFLKLVSSSDLVNAGTPSGTDIGAIESY